MEIRKNIYIEDINVGDVLAIGKDMHFITVSKKLKFTNGDEPYYVFIYFEDGYWHEVTEEYISYRIVAWTENDDYLVDKIEK